MRTTQYKVVINHEEQYSIIPVNKTISRDYRELGISGTKEACLNHIEEVWTDMKPTDKDRLLRSIKG